MGLILLLRQRKQTRDEPVTTTATVDLFSDGGHGTTDAEPKIEPYRGEGDGMPVPTPTEIGPRALSDSSAGAGQAPGSVALGRGQAAQNQTRISRIVARAGSPIMDQQQSHANTKGYDAFHPLPALPSDHSGLSGGGGPSPISHSTHGNEVFVGPNQALAQSSPPDRPLSGYSSGGAGAGVGAAAVAASTSSSSNQDRDRDVKRPLPLPPSSSPDNRQPMQGGGRPYSGYIAPGSPPVPMAGQAVAAGVGVSGDEDVGGDDGEGEDGRASPEFRRHLDAGEFTEPFQGPETRERDVVDLPPLYDVVPRRQQA